MTLKVYQAFEFEMLYNRLKDEQLPLKVSYRLSKIYNALIEQANSYHEDLAKTIDQYAMKNPDGTYQVSEDGSSVTLQAGTEQECAKKLNDLQNQNIKFSCDVRFNLDDLDGISVSTLEMQALLPFIDD